MSASTRRLTATMCWTQRDPEAQDWLECSLNSEVDGMHDVSQQVEGTF